jgi:hypothetical protein
VANVQWRTREELPVVSDQSPIPSGAPIPSSREDSTKSRKSRIVPGKMELWICKNGVLGHINASIHPRNHKPRP